MVEAMESKVGIITVMVNFVSACLGYGAQLFDQN